MNLEEFLAGAVTCLGIGILAGIAIYCWLAHDDRKARQLWEDGLIGRELDIQTEKIAAQKDRAEAELMRESAKQLMADTRRKLHQVAADAVELDDEMADTKLIPAVTTDDTVAIEVVGPDGVWTKPAGVDRLDVHIVPDDDTVVR